MSDTRLSAEVVSRFQRLKAECQQIGQKMAELEGDKNDHECGPRPPAAPRCRRLTRSAARPRSLVIETLSKTDEGRRCFRMVGGVLVERTVKEVLPAVADKRDNVRPLPRRAAPRAPHPPAPRCCRSTRC